MGSPTEVTTTQHTLSFVIKQTSSQDDIVTGSTHTQRGGDARVRVAEGHLRILAITDDFSQRNILGHNLQTRTTTEEGGQAGGHDGGPKTLLHHWGLPPAEALTHLKAGVTATLRLPGCLPHQAGDSSQTRTSPTPHFTQSLAPNTNPSEWFEVRAWENVFPILILPLA